MKYTNGQVFVWILTFLVAKFVWNSTCHIFFCTSCPVFYCTCYFTSLIRLVKEMICTVFCHIWLLYQIGQRNDLHCILSYLIDCYTRLVRDTSCLVLYHTCALFHVRLVRDISCPVLYHTCVLFHVRLVRDTSCPVLYHIWLIVTPDWSETPAVLYYIIHVFCFTSEWSEIRPEVYSVLHMFHPQWIRKIACSIFCYTCMLHHTGQTPRVLCSVIPAFLIHTSWVRNTTCSAQGSARAPWCPLCWLAFTWPTWKPHTCLC